MSLPDPIEIIPLSEPVSSIISLPGSKSITNRALILAALAPGPTELRGALWSEDTQVMAECLNRLGIPIHTQADPSESGNRVLFVQGGGGTPGNGGTRESPLELFVGNAGTAARFLSALVCLGNGWYRLDGVPRMRERPQAALFDALRQLGYQVDSDNDRLPVTIEGKGPLPGICGVRIEESSQFASALLLCRGNGMWTVQVSGEHEENSPYVRMTEALIDSFPAAGGVFEIEPDASSGSYFLAANALLGPDSSIGIADWPTTGWQVDARFPEFLPLPASISRNGDLGDSILTAMILAPFAEHPVRFADLERLRVQECERVAAMREELTRCGAEVLEDGETLIVSPSANRLHGASIETYDDHRMAMCFSILGLIIPGIEIKNPACVKKTFPGFFQKLAMPPPEGLGISIRNPVSGARMTPHQLAAD